MNEDTETGKYQVSSGCGSSVFSVEEEGEPTENKEELHIPESSLEVRCH